PISSCAVGFFAVCEADFQVVPRGDFNVFPCEDHDRKPLNEPSLVVLLTLPKLHMMIFPYDKVEKLTQPTATAVGAGRAIDSTGCFPTATGRALTFALGNDLRRTMPHCDR